MDINKIILGTGSYSSVKDGNMVSITGDGGKAWGFTGPSFKKLAPKLVTYIPYSEAYKELMKLKEDPTKEDEYLAFRRKIEDDYIESYYENRLKDIDIIEVIDRLNEIYGNDIILLCHEPIYDFCHRRLVADYIELMTGIYIPEVEIDRRGKIKKLTPIRYTDRLNKVINK